MGVGVRESKIDCVCTCLVEINKNVTSCKKQFVFFGAREKRLKISPLSV